MQSAQVSRGGIGGHTAPNRGATDTWITPRHVLAALGPFDVDPCAHTQMPWPTAERMLTVNDDGLTADWGCGFFWLNPPYGSETGRWLQLGAKQGNGIALVFARTETAMFFDEVWAKARGVLFLRGRLCFHYPDGSDPSPCTRPDTHAWALRPNSKTTYWCAICGQAKSNSGGPSALVGYGHEAATRLAHCSLPGEFIDRRKQLGSEARRG